MDQTVDDGGYGLGIAEDLGPVAEVLFEDTMRLALSYRLEMRAMNSAAASGSKGM